MSYDYYLDQCHEEHYDDEPEEEIEFEPEEVDLEEHDFDVVFEDGELKVIT